MSSRRNMLMEDMMDMIAAPLPLIDLPSDENRKSKCGVVGRPDVLPFRRHHNHYFATVDQEPEKILRPSISRPRTTPGIGVGPGTPRPSSSSSCLLAGVGTSASAAGNASQQQSSSESRAPNLSASASADLQQPPQGETSCPEQKRMLLFEYPHTISRSSAAGAADDDGPAGEHAQNIFDSSLNFDSVFESGNLLRAERLYNTQDTEEEGHQCT